MNTNNTNAVEVTELEKKFGNFTAVDKITFNVAAGEIFGFLGPNGAGKSTTIKMLCGILTPTSGKGRVSGFDIIRQQEHIRQNIGYMSQRFSLYEDLTVEENIDFYSGIYRIPAAKKTPRKDWVLEMAGLKDLCKNMTKSLSVGWKQRLALGCAIIHEPQIIFLDEPTSGVDPISRKNFWSLIKNMAAGGVTVFVTTHYMGEAENCDRMALIYRGDIIAMGSPAQLKTDFMKNDCLEISIANSEEWIDELNDLSVVKEAALFGADIHAVVENAVSAIPVIEEMLRQETDADFRVSKIPPSLEDVFVSLIETHDRMVTNNEYKKS